MTRYFVDVFFRNIAQKGIAMGRGIWFYWLSNGVAGSHNPERDSMNVCQPHPGTTWIEPLTDRCTVVCRLKPCAIMLCSWPCSIL